MFEDDPEPIRISDLRHIWCVPAYGPFTQLPLTSTALLEAENLLGFKLPAEFVEILQYQNGGYLAWKLMDSSRGLIHGIGPKFPALKPQDWSTFGDWLPFDVADGGALIPFQGDGHWFHCFDYRGSSSSPVITEIDTEGVREERVADSFNGYVALLEPDITEDELAITGVSDMQSLLAEICRHFSMTPTGYSGTNGEAVAGRDSDDDRQWLALRPNLVSRIAFPEGGPDALTFQELLPGLTKQFPGLPASASIMSISSELLPDLKKFLQSAGVTFQRLVDCPTLFQPCDEHE